METLNKNHISYQELDGLIELAEKVSENVETLKNKVISKKVNVMLYTLFSIIIVISRLPNVIERSFHIVISNEIFGAISNLLMILLGGIFMHIIFKFMEISKSISTINREKLVLQKLLNMIEGYKELYFEDEYGNEPSVLSKALFEMRLSRINFGVK
jgi:hypothetical protein